ncbi:MAG: phosphate ABC transporter permease subunit PstC [Bacteroidales bacterium]|nr:phosphate ABC transporter permease subunit PstC [Bacteroidales bacterium]
MKKLRKLYERLTEGTLFLCGNITGIAILLIVLFLFREGIGFFGRNSVEEGYVLALNRKNPVNKLSSREIKDIFDAEITNWEEVDGLDREIVLFRLNDITNYVTEEELGEEFEHIPECIAKIIHDHPDMIAFFPKAYLTENFSEKVLQVERIGLLEFFGGDEWMPTATPSAQFGILSLIMGTLWVSFGAILIALPLGIGVAIYLAEVANKRFRNFLKPVIELLAGIPSVVYGFFGLVVLVPFVQKTFNLPIGETGLSGSIILAIMALPTIITIAEDAMRTTPLAMKEASLALGATRWQTVYKVVLPYSSSGIMAAAILGIGRAIGETMAVLMVTGNAAIIPHSLLEPLRTIPATIAAELGEAPKHSTHYQALFLLGVILFIITLIINISVEFVKRKRV